MDQGHNEERIVKQARKLNMPIPYKCKRHHVHGEDFDRLVLVIRGLDSVYLDKQNRDSKKAIKSKGKGSFNKPQAVGTN